MKLRTLLLASMIAFLPILLLIPQAAAPLPVTQPSTTLFYRDWETYPTGDITTSDENTYISLQNNPGSSSAEISTAQARSGTQSLEMDDADAAIPGEIILHVNSTLPAIAPDYVAEFWLYRDASATSGYNVFRLVGNYSTNNEWQPIATGVTTGSNALGGCPTTSICFYNTSSAAYEQADTLAYDTWYEVTWHVQYDAVSEMATVDAYLNDTLEQDGIPLASTGLGLYGAFHAFVFQGDGAAARTSLMYYDDLAIKGGLTDTASGTYSVTDATVTPTYERIDFNDFRYVQEAEGVTQYSFDGVDGWTVAVEKVLDLGAAGYQDDEGVDQGAVFLEDGTYYLYYSMRSGAPGTVIGLATSTDGENFTRYTGNGDGPTTRAVVFPLNPVSGQFDDYNTYDPSYVTWRTDRYWMIYTGTDTVDGGGARYLSGLAYSYNLTWWQRYPDNSTNVPFIDAPPGDDCYADAQFQSVSWDPSASLYRALVRCKLSEPSTVRTVHQATSPDLITWTMGDSSSGGRVLPEPFVHSGDIFLRDGLWYLIYDRFSTPPQSDIRVGLAFSSDGVFWQNTKFVFLAVQTIPGIATNSSNSPDTHTAYEDFDVEAGTMRLWVSGPSTDGFRYISIIERPINRFRYVEVLPGGTTGSIITHPLTVAARGIMVNVANNATSNVTVEILSAAGSVIYSASDPVTASGASVVVTWDGASAISLPSVFKVRVRFAAGAQLFDVGFIAGSFQAEATSWLLEYGPAWAALLVGVLVFALIFGSFYTGIKKRKRTRTGKIWKYMPRKFR